VASDSSPVLFNYSLRQGSSGFYANENSVVPGSFPFVVHFKSGLTEYTGGDSINITSVRGTSKYIKLGSYYQISGTYRLADFSRAMLATHITTTRWMITHDIPQQSMMVANGSGNFTLVLPVKNLGWPHLAFYPDHWITDSDTHYFGTGDSVLHSWHDKPPLDESTGSGAAE